MESETNKSKREEVNSYLRTVAIDALQTALVVLVLEKPADPIGFLSDYFAGALPDELAQAPSREELATDIFELNEVKVYLDCTVSGAVRQALRELVRQRPPKPPSFLASYFHQRRLLPRADPSRPAPALAAATSASQRPESGPVGSRARRRLEEQRAHLARLQEQRQAEAHARARPQPPQQRDEREREAGVSDQGGETGGGICRTRGGRPQGRRTGRRGEASRPRWQESAVDALTLQEVSQELAQCLAAARAGMEPVQWALRSIAADGANMGGEGGGGRLNRGHVTALSGAIVGAVDTGALSLAQGRAACERVLERELGVPHDQFEEGRYVLSDASRLRILMELGNFCNSVKKLMADAQAAVEAPLRSQPVLAAASSAGQPDESGAPSPQDEAAALASDIVDILAMMPLLAMRVDQEAAAAQAGVAQALWPDAPDPLSGCWAEVEHALDGLWESLVRWKTEALAALTGQMQEDRGPSQADIVNSLFLGCTELEAQLASITTRFGALLAATGCMGADDTLPPGAQERLVVLYRGFFLAGFVELADLAVQTTAAGGRAGHGAEGPNGEWAPSAGKPGDADASSSLRAHIDDMRAHVEGEIVAALARLAEKGARAGATGDVEAALREHLGVIWRTLADVRHLVVTLRGVAGAMGAPTEGEVAAFQAVYASSNPDATHNVDDGEDVGNGDGLRGPGGMAGALTNMDAEALLAGKSRQELRVMQAVLVLRAAMEAASTTFKSCLSRMAAILADADLPSARSPNTRSSHTGGAAPAALAALAVVTGMPRRDRILSSVGDRVEAALVGLTQGLAANEEPGHPQHGRGGAASGLMAREVESFANELVGELNRMQQDVVAAKQDK
eukprot:jgi/Mesvir1/4707/Mv05633-RA.1